MRVLTWFRNNNNNFHQLSTVDLSHSHFSGLEGVYIIWYKPKLDIIQTVYVGKGEIRERLRSHQNDAQIRLYGPSSGNTLYQINGIYPILRTVGQSNSVFHTLISFYPDPVGAVS